MIIVSMTILGFGWPTRAVLRCLDIRGGDGQADTAAHERGTRPAAGVYKWCSDHVAERMQKVLMTGDAMIQRRAATRAASLGAASLLSHPRISMGIRDGVSPQAGDGSPRAADDFQQHQQVPTATSAVAPGLGLDAGQIATLQAAFSAPAAGRASVPGRSLQAAAIAESVPIEVRSGRPSAPARLMNAGGVNSWRPSFTVPRSSRMLCDP